MAGSYYVLDVFMGEQLDMGKRRPWWETQSPPQSTPPLSRAGKSETTLTKQGILIPTPMQEDVDSHLERVTIYTDGACIGNPGPGGYGAVVLKGAIRQELSGGYRLTTNNRMEMMAAIVGLQTLKSTSKVTLYSDSQYVVNAVMKGWAMRWRSNGWMRTASERAVNHDLWQQLLELCSNHSVAFSWIRGHSGIPENERCDLLAVHAAKGADLTVDAGYEHARYIS